MAIFLCVFDPLLQFHYDNPFSYPTYHQNMSLKSFLITLKSSSISHFPDAIARHFIFSQFCFSWHWVNFFYKFPPHTLDHRLEKCLKASCSHWNLLMQQFVKKRAIKIERKFSNVLQAWLLRHVDRWLDDEHFFLLWN